MYKSVFLSDVDGTLVKCNTQVPEPVVDAAQAYMAAGGGLALCTGRAPVSALPIARIVGVNLPCIMLAGAAVYDCQAERFLFMRPLPDDTSSVLSEMLHAYKTVSLQVITDRGVFVIRRNDLLNERGVREENAGPERGLSEIEGTMLKIMLCDDDPGKLEECRAALFPRERFNASFGSRRFVDIVAAGAGKGQAMEWLAQFSSLPVSRFFAAGDGMTDLPMMKLAGYSYAPVTALDDVKAAADMVIPSATEGGITVALRDAAWRTLSF
jgi:Cof subfamily protein (haloacid dehalogenase superfamily)